MIDDSACRRAIKDKRLWDVLTIFPHPVHIVYLYCFQHTGAKNRRKALRPATMPDGGINPVDSIRREPLSKWRENTGWENTCAGKNYGGMTLQGTGGWRGRLPGAPHTARLL